MKNKKRFEIGKSGVYWDGQKGCYVDKDGIIRKAAIYVISGYILENTSIPLFDWEWDDLVECRIDYPRFLNQFVKSVTNKKKEKVA